MTDGHLRIGMIGCGDVGARAEPLLDISQRTLEEINKAFKEFSKVAPEMEKALRESSATLLTIREAVPELKKTNENAHGLISQARQAMPRLDQTNAQAQRTMAEWESAGWLLSSTCFLTPSTW